MTKKEALQILAILKAAYPASYNGMTQKEATGTVAVWAMQFSDVPVDIVLMAVQKLISTNKFPPAISEVKAKMEGIHWEAYEALSCSSIPMSEEVREHYKRIYEATKEYKIAKIAEPTLYQMITGGTALQIEGN